MKTKVCKRCGGTYSEIFFRKRERTVYVQSRRAICMGCEQLEKDERKQRNRPKAKARNTFYHHADKFIAEGKAQSRADFASRYGWDVAQMAHDIQHSSKNGCPYCHQLFSEMPHGLADLTLDVIDPKKPPYYTTNVKWVCATCNKEKQRTPPEHWGAKLVAWEQWRQQQETLKQNPYAGFPLFSYASQQGQIELFEGLQ